MKTLWHCNSYSTTDLDWEKQWRRWYNHHKQVGLHFDQLLIVDNGSPELPGWSDTRVIYDLSRPWFANKGIIIYRYEDTLDFDAHMIRSVRLASAYAAHYGFKKLLQIESDVYILGKRLAKFINEQNNNHVVFPCETVPGFVGSDYGKTSTSLPDGIDYATGIDKDWDDIYTKHLDKKRNYTYNRT